MFHKTLIVSLFVLAVIALIVFGADAKARADQCEVADPGAVISTSNGSYPVCGGVFNSTQQGSRLVLESYNDTAYDDLAGCWDGTLVPPSYPAVDQPNSYYENKLIYRPSQGRAVVFHMTEAWTVPDRESVDALLTGDGIYAWYFRSDLPGYGYDVLHYEVEGPAFQQFLPDVVK